MLSGAGRAAKAGLTAESKHPYHRSKCGSFQRCCDAYHRGVKQSSRIIILCVTHAITASTSWEA